jgi:hypothetical protein
MAVTAHDILLDAGLFHQAYPHWPHPEPEPSPVPHSVQIGGAWYSLDDAVTASAVLAEIDAGRDEDAARLARMTRLDALDRDGLEALCAAFGVEVYPLATLWDEWPGD